MRLVAHNRNLSSAFSRQSGISLLEVLVAIAVLTIGLDTNRRNTLDLLNEKRANCVTDQAVGRVPEREA